MLISGTFDCKLLITNTLLDIIDKAILLILSIYSGKNL